MTTIGSTSYYSTGRHINSNRSNSEAAYNRASDDRDPDMKSASTASSNSGSAQTAFLGQSSNVAVNLPGQSVTLMNLTVRGSNTLKQINISELPDAQYKFFLEQNQRSLEANRLQLENQYTDWSSTATAEASLKAFPAVSTPATQPYATVVVGGRVVATIDNQGVVGSDNNLGERLQNSLLGEINGTNGPDLAQARADRIAEILGGRVVKSDTAITQSTFNALPSVDAQRPKVNYEAMKGDPLYQQLQSMYARIEQIGHTRNEYLASQQDSILFYA